MPSCPMVPGKFETLIWIELLNAAPEFDDCRAAAEQHGVAVKEVMAAAMAAFRKGR